jgi:hypothetical protein
MKRSILIMALTIGVCNVAFSGTQNKSIATQDTRGGWSAAKWGMSPDEVARAFEGKETLVPSDDRWGNEGDPDFSVGKWGIKNFGIGGEKFDVTFFFNPKEKMLDKVSLTDLNSSSAMEIAFGNLEKLLIEKYGQPTIRSGGTEAEPGTGDKRIESSWILKNNVITLKFFMLGFSGEAEPISNLSLLYKKPMDEQEKQKL